MNQQSPRPQAATLGPHVRRADHVSIFPQLHQTHAFTPPLLRMPEQIPTLKSARGGGVSLENPQTRGGHVPDSAGAPWGCVELPAALGGSPCRRMEPTTPPATCSLHGLCPLPSSAPSLQQQEGQREHDLGGVATQLTGAGVGPGAQSLCRPRYLTAWPCAGKASVESRPRRAAWVGWKGPCLSASAGSTACRRQAKGPSPSGQGSDAAGCSLGCLLHQAPHAHTKCLVWKGQKTRALCWGSPPPRPGRPHTISPLG